MDMSKATAKQKINLALDEVRQVLMELGHTDARINLAEMEIAGQAALERLTHEATEEQARLITGYRSMFS